ncbi:uncharacterized protein LOC110099520 [Dendrobium catenatum]|uniref:uncharacterized protein LOC110099520 n=1 Tax=Dendrobium catenatum TaxID=906689 RepID=UPI0009F4CAD0|nr:uncharacterized protein LOC110099520 [Dendrobium catenatum]
MTHIFDDLTHNQVKCYITDLVVKSKVKEAHLYDLRFIFEQLRRYKLKMNPLKYSFDVTSVKFLGFIMRNHGIKIDIAKTEAILDMPPHKSLTQSRSLQAEDSSKICWKHFRQIILRWKSFYDVNQSGTRHSAGKCAGNLDFRRISHVTGGYNPSVIAGFL